LTLGWHEGPLPDCDDRSFVQVRASGLKDVNLRNMAIQIHGRRHHDVRVLMRRQGRRRILSIDVR
jgi:hypothetical protein